MNKVSTKINNFITYIMFVIENCVTIIAKDRVLLAFLIAGFIPNLIIKITSDMSLFNIRSLIFNFSWFCLIVGLSYKFKRKRSRIIYYSILTFVNYALTYSNLMYYRYYESFLSISLIKQLTLFGDVADATQVGMSAFDIIYWCLLFISIFFIILFSSIKKFSINENDIEVRVFNKFNFLRMFFISLVVGILTLAPANYSQAEKLWNRPIVVENFGLYNYHVIDLFKSVGVFFEHKPDESDYNKFITYFNEKNAYEKANNKIFNQYTNVAKGKNVIVIHAESLENFLINREINGQEITPYFNQIANSGLYFSNFYTQQSIGTSADSEFVFNTSLLPVNSGTVFLTHFDRTYNTTQKILRDNGYLTLYMHGNNGSFWNRKLMAPVLGYDVFFDKSVYSVDESNTIGLGISDYAFFQQSMEFLIEADNMGQPFYATLITLSNHTPWSEVEKYDTFNGQKTDAQPIDCGSQLDDTTVCRYLKSMHYADWAFGQFMKSLEETDILDKTLIVIYGDHEASLPKGEMEKLYGDEMTKVQYKSTQKVPFIIWSKNFLHREIKEVMGEYDVGPTLQNMLGVKNQFALGRDIFSIENNLVPFINGDWTDGVIYYDAFRNDYYIIDENVTDSMITNDYLKEKKEKVNKIIDMSNMINQMDLIKYYEKKNNITHVTPPDYFDTGGK